jgi:four helix bundle protein
MTYEEWELQLPADIRGDRLWEMELYRLALFLCDLAWEDVSTISRDFRGKEIGKQLIRAVGSIAANIEEGYGRGFGRDYARFLAYAIGSAREARGWYYRARSLLREEVLQHRVSLLTKITKLAINANQAQRKITREEAAEYTTDSSAPGLLASSP